MCTRDNQRDYFTQPGIEPAGDQDPVTDGSGNGGPCQRQVICVYLQTALIYPEKKSAMHRCLAPCFSL